MKEGGPNVQHGLIAAANDSPARRQLLRTDGDRTEYLGTSILQGSGAGSFGNLLAQACAHKAGNC